MSARDAGSSEDHAAMTLRDEIAKALAASNSWMLAHECRDSADALLPIVERVAREGVMLMHESCIACITAAEDTEHVDAIVRRVMEGQRTTQWCGEVERLRHDIERHMQSVMVAEDRAERAEVDAEIGRKWHADSSLETWFPYTAEELTRLRAELTRLRAELVAARADAERYRVARAKVCIVGDAFHVINLRPTYVAPDAAIEFDAAIDAARAGGETRQHKPTCARFNADVTGLAPEGDKS